METDKLKEFWKKDQQEVPEISLKSPDDIRSPLEMIRVNMQTEFWILLILLPSILYGFPYDNSNDSIIIISVCEVLIYVCLIIYFYSRFLIVYRLLKTKSSNTNFDLFTIKTQLLVAKETYISYYISYIPLALLICLINVNFKLNDVYYFSVFAVSMLISIVVIFIMIRFWIYYMYGKYIDEVVSIIDELNDIPVHSKRKKENSWFEKSQFSLTEKFGIKGHVLNTVLWFFLSYISLTTVLFIILLIFITSGIALNFIDQQMLMKVLNS